MLKVELEQLLSIDISKIISKYKDIPAHEISLKLNKDKTLPHRAIAEQIECFKKAEKKLPSLVKKSLIFEKLALEQASSEFTAKYKATLMNGNTLVDLTGGLGIDDIHFSKSIKKIYYCEIKQIVADIFKYNIEKLKIKNTEVINSDSIEFLYGLEDNSIDWIYIDPARRDENRRTVDLDFCSPNVYDNLELLFTKSSKIMIKVAPAFDISEAIRRFINLSQVHIISVDGECKEVVLILNSEISNIKPTIFSVSLQSKNEFKTIFSGEYITKQDKNSYEIKDYFYEPDCSIIKSNLTPLLANKYKMTFINQLTPYLSSNEFTNDFPGRSFKVITTILFNERKIKEYLKEKKIIKANIARRDFRLSVDEIKAKFKIKDGGDVYFFFTSDFNRRNIMIVCEKTI